MSVLLLSPDQARRFWAKVQQRGECWEWTASHGSTGYGQFAIDGVLYSVHRISYMLHVDVIPDDLTIDHLCMNKSCVNPRHLEPVTAGENSRRAWEAGLVMEPPLAEVNRRKTHCSRGHAFDEANTHIATDGHRTCRACKREADRRRRNPDKPQRTCAKCGGLGHYAITCDVEDAS